MPKKHRTKSMEKLAETDENKITLAILNEVFVSVKDFNKDNTNFAQNEANLRFSCDNDCFNGCLQIRIDVFKCSKCDVHYEVKYNDKGAEITSNDVTKFIKNVRLVR